MKLKLCAVVPKHWSAMMGGSQLQVKFLFDTLKNDNRFTLYYITRQSKDDYIPADYQIIKIPGKKVIGRRCIIYECYCLYRLLKKIQPDIIYQRVGCAYTGVAAFYAKKHNCKMIWHIAHDSDVLPLKQFRSIQFNLSLTDKLLLKYGLKISPCIIAQSSCQALLLRRYYNKSPQAIIPNFHPSALETAQKGSQIKIVWIANFKKWKQPECFIKLAEKLAERQIDVECIMIGKPSRDRLWQKELEAKIECVNNLSYLGTLHIDQVNAILSNAHIFVNTSIAEGFANSAIQSWLRNVPVVSLHCSFDNVLEKEQIGFHTGTFDRLLEKIELLVQDHSLRHAMGIRAQNYAEKRHSQKNIEQLRTLFLDS